MAQAWRDRLTKKTTDATADAKSVRTWLYDKNLEGRKRHRLLAATGAGGSVLSLSQIAEKVGISARTVGEAGFEALALNEASLGLLAR